jgi:hypothetical protein
MTNGAHVFGLLRVSFKGGAVGTPEQSIIHIDLTKSPRPCRDQENGGVDVVVEGHGVGPSSWTGLTSLLCTSYYGSHHHTTSPIEVFVVVVAVVVGRSLGRTSVRILAAFIVGKGGWLRQSIFNAKNILEGSGTTMLELARSLQ